MTTHEPGYYRDLLQQLLQETEDTLQQMRDRQRARQLVRMTEPEQIAHVQQFPQDIGLIRDPSEAVQLAAVKAHGMVIRHIAAPSEAVQLAAVNQAAFALSAIGDPSERVQLAAISRYPPAIRTIANPSARAIALARSLGYDRQGKRL